MNFRHEGNGNSKTQIDFLDRPGYVLICPHDLENPPAAIALILNNALNDWLKKHPSIRVRSILPITKDGQTTAIHLWYDQADETK